MTELRDLFAVPHEDSLDDTTQGRHRSAEPGEAVEPETRLVRTRIAGAFEAATPSEEGSLTLASLAKLP